jgi:predicted transcriptional regulator
LKRSIHYETYPSSVSDVTERLLEGLEEAEFFQKEEADYDVTFKRFADFFFTRWVNGEDMEDFPEKEFSDILNRSIIESDIKRLSERELLDSIEDESGETLYFVTEKGKREMEKLKSK